jgi:hypothetical protein
MLPKLSTRRYRVVLEPVGAAVQATATSTSKSAVSRRFVAATEKALGELLAADLSGLDLVAELADLVRAHRPPGHSSRCPGQPHARGPSRRASSALRPGR